MAVTDQLKSLVAQMPTADGRGMLTENIDKERIDATTAAIAKGGAEHLLGLIELLAEPGSEADVQPHYALHCVVNYPLVTRDEKLRREFGEALAAQLQNKQLHPVNRAYLCQELQWAGRDEACPALGVALLDDDTTDAAATALVAIGGERAAKQLRSAAAQARGKARLNVLDALAALADPQSATIFQEALKDGESDVRLAAGAGLARLGLPDSVEPLLAAADKATGWERTQATKSCLVLAESLAAGGHKSAARKLYERLQSTRTNHQERHILEAARLGLAALA